VRDRVEAVIQVGEGEWLSFVDPEQIVRADRPNDVRAAIADVERLTRDRGFHAVGFVAYEAGAAFGLAVRPPASDLPQTWFALFDPAHVTPVAGPVPHIEGRDYRLGPLSPSIDRAAFGLVFDRIKRHLADGDSYQVNFTFKMTGLFEGDPRALFDNLVAAQRGGYSAFIRFGHHTICSASPELFFSLDGPTVSARPMKGTARRGRTLAEDLMRRHGLRDSEKERAENVMVVDMIRNDLGRVAEVGSVAVPELFRVERYPNVWQMTSLVSARSAAALDEIFAAVHPSASVTGAPKVRTMEILSELESGPRGIYTGAIGHVRPDGNATFNVAIRTAIVDDRAGTIEFGIGSGIVWDSDAAAEYEECLLKGSILAARPVEFELLETVLWSPSEGFFLLDRHLARLSDSAEYFGVPVEVQRVRTWLDDAVVGATGDWRLRVLVDSKGHVRVEKHSAVQSSSPLTVTFAAHPVDRNDVFLYHKTTNRAVYESARVPGFDEVILWNADDEVTEAITANVVAAIGGRKVTPPVACGLLAGTYRAELLASGAVEEAVIKRNDLRSADGIWLVNSVQKSRVAVFGSR
jgi:para-aminobenzoate synthetase/4-amino-4-deoxychorismate lyase